MAPFSGGSSARSTRAIVVLEVGLEIWMLGSLTANIAKSVILVITSFDSRMQSVVVISGKSSVTLKYGEKVPL